jgi:hypothetical protein
LVLKAIFVDEPQPTNARLADVLTPDLLARTGVTLLAAAILLFGIVPGILTAPILAAVQ